MSGNFGTPAEEAATLGMRTYERDIRTLEMEAAKRLEEKDLEIRILRGLLKPAIAVWYDSSKVMGRVLLHDGSESGMDLAWLRKAEEHQ